MKKAVLLIYLMALSLSASAQSLMSLIETNGVQLIRCELEEYSFAPREGPLRLYVMEGVSIPWAGIFDSAGFPATPFVMTTDIGKICGDNIRLAGGTSGGWLLGPYSPELAGEPPLPEDAGFLFAVLFGSDLGDGSWEIRDSCGGGNTDVAFGLQFLILYPEADFSSSRNAYQIADILYADDIGEQWYRVFSGQPFFNSSQQQQQKSLPQQSSDDVLGDHYEKALRGLFDALP